MRDLLLPATDGGVLVQVLVAGAVYGAALFATRRNRDVLLFVAGLATMTFAWFGIRALH